MKKKILAATLFVVLTATAFAGKNDNGRQMLSDLQKAIKNSAQVQWSNTSDYTKGIFSFNGKSVSGFYDPDNGSLIGFSIHLVGNDFPQDASNAIQKKYPDWRIADAIYFIDSDGNASYFSKIEEGKHALAVKVSNGHVSIYSTMPAGE